MVRRMPAELSAVSSHAIALDASPEEPQEGAVDAALGWFSLYLPSWGSSFVLHVAVVILAIFIGTAPFVPQEGFMWTAVPEPQPPKPIIEKRPVLQSKKALGDLGRLNKPGPHTLFRVALDNPIRDVAANNLDRLDIIGIGGGGHDRGDFDGMPGGRGGTIFVTEGRPNKIVYVVDRSGSMTDSIDYVKLEMKRSIATLLDGAEFHVIFYSTGPAQEMPMRRLVPASEHNKELAFEFIDSIVADGQTDPSKALEKAFAVKPDMVYLLTDGEFDRQIIDLVKRLNVGGRVKVNTIGFLYTMPGTASEEILKTIASQNGGHYKFVSVEDLSALGQP